jgi:hypothetical protein
MHLRRETIMSTLSGISPYSSIGYDSGVSTPASSVSATNTQSNNAPAAHDTVDLQSDASLISSMFPQSNSSATASASYPTNIEQAAQDQALYINNPDLSQTISQEQSSSPAIAPLTADMQALQMMGSASQTSSSLSSSLSSAISGMEALKEVTSANALTTNPSMAQALLQAYDPGLNLPQSGSLVNTTA